MTFATSSPPLVVSTPTSCVNRPALLPREGQQPGEVLYRPAEAVELGYDEGVCVPVAQHCERFLQRGSRQRPSGQALVRERDHLPALADCVRRDGVVLRFKAKARAALFFGGDSGVADDGSHVMFLSIIGRIELEANTKTDGSHTCVRRKGPLSAGGRIRPTRSAFGDT